MGIVRMNRHHRKRPVLPGTPLSVSAHHKKNRTCVHVRMNLRQTDLYRYLLMRSATLATISGFL